MSAPFNLTEGSVVQYLLFPSIWPVHDDVLLFGNGTHIPSLAIEVYGSDEGRLIVLFEYEGKRRNVFTSVPIKLVEGQFGFILIEWGDFGVRVDIMATPIREAGSTDAFVSVKLADAPPGNNGLSFNDEVAKEKCTPWIAWRKKHLSDPKVGPGRIAKTVPEQIQELEYARIRLVELLQRVQSGETFWLGSLVVELRSLIHWKDRDFEPTSKNPYKQIPLLMRIAQYRDLPLPVYVLQESKRPYEMSQPEAVLDTTVFSVVHKFPTFVPADLQDWLAQPGFYDNRRKPWAMKDIIAGYAETLGPGHYDSGIPAVQLVLSQSYNSHSSS